MSFPLWGADLDARQNSAIDVIGRVRFGSDIGHFDVHLSFGTSSCHPPARLREQTGLVLLAALLAGCDLALECLSGRKATSG
jgi:hypothetical protein